MDVQYNRQGIEIEYFTDNLPDGNEKEHLLFLSLDDKVTQNIKKKSLKEYL